LSCIPAALNYHYPVFLLHCHFSAATSTKGFLLNLSYYSVNFTFYFVFFTHIYIGWHRRREPAPGFNIAKKKIFKKLLTSQFICI